MVEIKVTITGLDDFAEGIKMAPQETVKELSTAINKSILVIHNQALREAPVNKQTGGGNLRQNIKSRMVSRLIGEVASLAPYSVFVHEGTSPHVIVPVNKRVLANVRTGQIFGKRVNHPGTKANPFLYRALERSANKIEQILGDASLKIVKFITK